MIRYDQAKVRDFIANGPEAQRAPKYARKRAHRFIEEAVRLLQGRIHFYWHPYVNERDIAFVALALALRRRDRDEEVEYALRLTHGFALVRRYEAALRGEDVVR